MASSKGSSPFNCWSRSDHIFEWNREYESVLEVWWERLLTEANSSRAEGQEGGAGQAADGAGPSEDLANPSLGLDLNSNPPLRWLAWRYLSSHAARFASWLFPLQWAFSAPLFLAGRTGTALCGTWLFLTFWREVKLWQMNLSNHLEFRKAANSIYTRKLPGLSGRRREKKRLV